MTLGEKLKEARKQAGLSQDQLAQQLSLSQSTVAKWESDLGVPSINNLRALSQLLGISIQELLVDPPGTAQAADPPALLRRRAPVTAADSRRHLILWKQRLLFLLAAYLLLSFCIMWTPRSATQVGLPDLTTIPITHITTGGNRPRLSTQDPSLQAADPAVIAEHLSRIQSLLDETDFYCRTPPLNPLQLMTVPGTWVLVETETDQYRFGDYHGLLFIEINGARLYYRKPPAALTKEIRLLQSYFIDLNNAYYRELEQS